MKSYLTNPFLLFIFISSLFFGCQEIGGGDPPSHDAPKEIISVEQAREMYNAYSTRRVPIIREYEDSIVPGPVFTPTRYAEYDLETIKQYIAYIEHEAKQAQVSINTLRFYLANYPNTDKFEDGGKVKYPRRNTFFVVPTTDFEGRNAGFTIEDINGKPTAVPINRHLAQQDGQEQGDADTKGKVNSAGFSVLSDAAAMGIGKSVILNESHLSPPPGENDFGNDN